MAVCSYKPEGVGEAVQEGVKNPTAMDGWVCGMRRTVEDAVVVGREGVEVEGVCGVGLGTQSQTLRLLSLLFAAVVNCLQCQ